jgi:hypothetical protein
MQAEAEAALGRQGWPADPKAHPLGQLPPTLQRVLAGVLLVIMLWLWLGR